MLSFRTRMVLAFTVLAVGAVGLEGGLGYWQFRQTLQQSLTGDLELRARTVAQAIDLHTIPPTLIPERLSEVPGWNEGRFRVQKDGLTYLDIGGPFPPPGPGWLRTRIPLEQGYLLEAAIPAKSLESSLAAYLCTLSIALPITLLLAVFLTALLLGYLMRPVHHLTKAAHDLAQQRFPEPIPIPSGNDELTQLAQSFNRMSHAVRGFLEREKSFTRYASHELRTPLATLRAQIEAMQQGLVSQAEAMPHLEAGLRRIEDILNGLLTLTRNPEPDPHPLQLHALVESVVAGMPPACRRRIEITLEGATWTVGPRELVAQAIGNLIENACKYSQGPVRVHLGKTGQEVFVQVRDQGPGVPEEALARLGEPFLRLNPQIPGLGLGLALVRHIARSLSGNVHFRNLRPGLEVTLSLPKANPPREEAHARATRT